MVFDHDRAVTHKISTEADYINRVAQYQVSQNASVDGGGGHKIPPLAEELLASDGCWDEEESVSFRCGPW